MGSSAGVATSHGPTRRSTMIDIAPAVDQLGSINWFANAGRSSSSFSFTINFCQSWQEAQQLRSTVIVSDLLLEERNRYTQYLSIHHRDEYRKWNSIAARARASIDTMLNSIVLDGRMTAINTPDVDLDAIIACMKWDLSNFLMEYAYSDIASTGVYSDLREVYQQGHFPCHIYRANNLILVTIY